MPAAIRHVPTNDRLTYQTIRAAITLHAKLVASVATLEQRNQPVQVTASRATHEPARSIAHAWLLLVWELFKTL
jgi:hypothetical protein